MKRSEFLELALPELVDLEYFLKEDCVGKIEILAEIKASKNTRQIHRPIHSLPIYKISYGSNDSEKPTLILTAGVHGLERIGTQVVKALLFSFNEVIQWDQELARSLKNFRLIFIPLINPWGMALRTRSNGNGVDLMRNAPIEATGKTVPFLSGHRIGPKIPWYRGASEQGMEVEAEVLISEIQKSLKSSKATISVDFHSGFGFKDQLWFPYAKSLEPLKHLAEIYAVKKILDRTYPYHIYQVEPQALNYVTHGDLWDYLYDEHCKIKSSTYLPLCLEMGSWNWVRKNPAQILIQGGIFDPILPHRRHRAFRRHHLLFDLLLRLMQNTKEWTQIKGNKRKLFESEAHKLWYSNELS